MYDIWTKLPINKYDRIVKPSTQSLFFFFFYQSKSVINYPFIFCLLHLPIYISSRSPDEALTWLHQHPLFGSETWQQYGQPFSPCPSLTRSCDANFGLADIHPLTPTFKPAHSPSELSETWQLSGQPISPCLSIARSYNANFGLAYPFQHSRGYIRKMIHESRKTWRRRSNINSICKEIAISHHFS